jgi:hypothetical protein
MSLPKVLVAKTLRRLLLPVSAMLLASGCSMFAPQPTNATTVRGIRGTQSELVLRAPYKDKRVELPAGVYKYMQMFSSAKQVCYVSPEPIRKRELLGWWTTHPLAWLVIPADGQPGDQRVKWVVWANGSNDYVGEDFTYEIRATGQ